jgi:hypothetical protein
LQPSKDGLTLDAHIAGFLLFHENADVCDACLAARVRATPAEVEAAIARLRRSARVFLRDRWTCQLCGNEAQVTRGLAGSTVALKTPIRRRASRIA